MLVLLALPPLMAADNVALPAPAPTPAPSSPTEVTLGKESHFDVAAIGNWIDHHVYLFLLVAAVAFVFFIFQKGGFAEKFLEFRSKRDALEAKRLDDLRAIADVFDRKDARADPLLPFDDPVNRRDE